MAFTVAALLAACTTGQEVQTGGHKCAAANTEGFVGQPATAETGEAILRATNAAILRWAPPGYMLTMDYREDRVTVRLGADRKVTEIGCG